jgi:hypothetical protein
MIVPQRPVTRDIAPAVGVTRASASANASTVLADVPGERIVGDLLDHRRATKRRRPRSLIRTQRGSAYAAGERAGDAMCDEHPEFGRDGDGRDRERGSRATARDALPADRPGWSSARRHAARCSIACGARAPSVQTTRRRRCASESDIARRSVTPRPDRNRQVTIKPGSDRSARVDTTASVAATARPQRDLAVADSTRVEIERRHVGAAVRAREADEDVAVVAIGRQNPS